MAAAGGVWRRIGGFGVRPPALNLLRYPQRGLALPLELAWPLLLAVLAGLALGSAWVAWQSWRLDHLLEQRGHLQADVQALERQKNLAAALQTRKQWQKNAEVRAQDWRARRDQLQHLQEVLGAQASALGVRVARWQGDRRQLVLQAWLPRAQDVPLLLSALTAAGPQGWTLQSLGDAAASGPHGGVDVVLQASWPSRVQDRTPAPS